MGEPNVDRMLEGMSDRQLNEWKAFELAHGPIDYQYEREILAQLHELIQMNNQLTGAAITRKGKKNPAGKFSKVVRPDEIYKPVDPDEVDDDQDEDDDELADYYDVEEDVKLDPAEEQARQIAAFDREVFGAE